MSDPETPPTLEAVTGAIKHQQAEADGAPAVRAFLADLAPDLAAARQAVQESTAIAQEISPRLGAIDRALAGVSQTIGGPLGGVLRWAREYRVDLGHLLADVERFRAEVARLEALTPQDLASRLHPGAEARRRLAMIINRPRDLREQICALEDQLLQLRRLGAPEVMAPTTTAPAPAPPARQQFAVSDTAESAR